MSEKSLIQKAAADFAAAELAPVSFVPEKTAEYTEDAVKAMAAKVNGVTVLISMLVPQLSFMPMVISGSP